jgi:hypothetical protein
MLIYVEPNEPKQLVLEASPDVHNNIPRPVNNVVIDTTDTATTVYAVLRDEYGNYVSYSTNNSWGTANSGIAVSRDGYRVDQGEGLIVRRAKSGRTNIWATNTIHDLSDTVSVVLNSVVYDSLRIVVGGSYPDSVIIRSDQDTVLIVEGKRSDNGQWEEMNGNWQFTSNTLPDQSRYSTSEWNFQPSNNGKGKIKVTDPSNRAVPDSIGLRILPGPPVKLVLYRDEGAPSVTNTPYPDPTSTIEVTTDNTLLVVAKMFDHKDVWLSSYESSTAPIEWKIIERQSQHIPTGTLSDTSGHRTVFTPDTAYNEVYIVATYAQGTKRYRDSILVYVKPGVPFMLVIEPNDRWQNSPNRKNELDTLRITKNEITGRVYAILRDAKQNYIAYDTNTAWTSLNTDTATVENGTKAIGEGIVSRAFTDNADTARVGQGKTRVRARSQTYPTLIDTVNISLVKYNYLALRIVDENYTEITDTLQITTNDNVTLYVQGQRSDDSTWENATANWEISDNLEVTPNPPSLSHEYTFSPDDTGRGTIGVSVNDPETQPDELPVIFARGLPTRLEFEVISNYDSLYAGDTIWTVVRIYNNDGLVPGEFCYPADGGVDADYWDPLGNGGERRPDPIVIVDGDTTVLGDSESNPGSIDQCFTNGIDTVGFVLYYAPYNKDSTHLLHVQLKDLHGESYPFILRAGPLDSLVIEEKLYVAAPDKITLYNKNNDAVALSSVGFDRFGNRRGPEPSNWTESNTLHEITKPNNVTRIIYNSARVEDNEEGTIRAVSVDTLGGTKSDSVYIVIIGPPTSLNYAITRDRDGDGYLDRIEVYFKRPFAFNQDYDYENIEIIYGSTELPVDNIVSLSGEPADSVFYFELDPSTSGELQTGWRPSLRISNLNEVQEDKIRCIDGAGPVIWKVEKKMGSECGSRTEDRVTVSFSESVYKESTTVVLTQYQKPEELYNVFQKITTSAPYDTIFDMFDNVGEDSVQVTTVTDSFYIFIMGNGKDLSQSHYLNFKTTPPILTDSSGNYPNSNNRKVQVVVTGPDECPLEPFPNPAQPTDRRIEGEVKHGEVYLTIQKDARNWVRQDKAGVVFSTWITLNSETANAGIKLYARIYDIVGNLVLAHTEENILELPRFESVKSGSGFNLDIYWHGYNEEGMQVAPGIYSVVVYIDSESYNAREQRRRTVIGIAY